MESAWHLQVKATGGCLNSKKGRGSRKYHPLSACDNPACLLRIVGIFIILQPLCKQQSSFFPSTVLATWK